MSVVNSVDCQARCREPTLAPWQKGGTSHLYILQFSCSKHPTIALWLQNNFSTTPRIHRIRCDTFSDVVRAVCLYQGPCGEGCDALTLTNLCEPPAGPQRPPPRSTFCSQRRFLPFAMDAEASAGVVPSVETPMEKSEESLPKPALTPPTSEDMDKRERMSSELTDLESSDDEEEIEPDHYFDGGKIPVFKPVRGAAFRTSSLVRGSALRADNAHSQRVVHGSMLTIMFYRQWISFEASRNSLTSLTSTG